MCAPYFGEHPSLELPCLGWQEIRVVFSPDLAASPLGATLQNGLKDFQLVQSRRELAPDMPCLRWFRR